MVKEMQVVAKNDDYTMGYFRGNIFQDSIPSPVLTEDCEWVDFAQ